MRQTRVAAFLLIPVVLVPPVQSWAGDEAGATSTHSIAAAIEKLRGEIENERAGLTALRRKITPERIELSRRVEGVAADIRRTRGEVGGRRARAEELESSLPELRDEVQDLEETLDMISSLVLNQRRIAETHLNIAEASSYSAQLQQLDSALESARDDPEKLLSAATGLLQLVVGHCEAESTVRICEGKAVGPDGIELRGNFIHLGGVMTLFAGDECGVVHAQLNSTRPHLQPVADADSAAAVRELARGSTADVPIDFTAGAALKVQEAQESLYEHLKAGGVVMIPLAGIAVFGIVVALVKLIQLLSLRTGFDKPLGELLGLLKSGRIEQAEQLAARTPAPLRPVMRECIDHRNASKESLEEIVYEVIAAETPRLSSYLPALAVSAAVAPLLGLLGTVTGMIHTFHLISIFGTADPKLLSGGISEALVTTETGLAIAIPLLLLHALLRRRVNSIVDNLETGASAFINGLNVGKAEAGETQDK